jgi:bifunctional ADP-heptose synthase (sugar kinase/adenylyltransferase)
VLTVLGIGLAAGISYSEAIAPAHAAAGVAVDKQGAAAVAYVELKRSPERHTTWLFDLSPETAASCFPSNSSPQA